MTLSTLARRRIATGHAQAEKRARTEYAKPKPSKYRNVPTVIDNIRFASKLEAKRYGELKLLERGRHIEKLRVHPVLHLLVNGHHICDYVADFSYTKVWEAELTTERADVVEDTKGVLTDVARLKLKMVKAQYGIDVQLIKRARK